MADSMTDTTSLQAEMSAWRLESTSLQSDTDSSFPPSTPATSIYPLPRKKGRSISLRRAFPTDLSSLLRSHSASRQRGSSTPPQNGLGSKNYAIDSENLDSDMYSASAYDPERPSRKSDRRKSENRLYNFLTRSRSRSRSKPRRPSSADGTLRNDHPPLPTGYSPHHRHSSASPTSPRSTSPSKPTSRLPSRPLSSATIATHSTITPLTPIPTTRERGRRKYVSNSTSPEPISVPAHAHALESSTSGSLSSRPSTTKATSTRMKLHNIFGIPLKSRPASPQRDPDVPEDHDPMPTKRNLFRSPSSRRPPVSRPQSPSRLKEKPKTSWRIFSNKHSPSSSHTNLRNPSGSLAVSAPAMLNRQSSRASASASSSRSSVPTPTTPTTPSIPRSRTSTSIPKINHIPPTPLKTPGQSRSASRAGRDGDEGLAVRDVVRGQRHDRTGSVGSVSGGVAKWSSGIFSGGFGGKRDKERDNIETDSTRSSSGSANGSGRLPTSGRAATLGSFDFEKPRGGSATYLSGSLDKGKTVAKANVKDSGQKSSSKSPTENKPRIHDRSMPPPPVPANRDQRARTATVMTHHTSVSVSSNGHSVSTANATNRSVLPPASVTVSSSLGRNGGRSASRMNTGHTHGSFAFEPAVHSPSDQSAQQISRSRSGSGSAEGVYKSHGKGRSLDLGLGLAWAPTKVREEAVIQSGFARTLSRDGNGNGRGREGRIGNSSNVTERFKAVLSESGFSAFKKYVRRFDANSIPFDGPTGIIARVEQLLDSAPAIDEQERQELMERFIRIILQNA